MTDNLRAQQSAWARAFDIALQSIVGDETSRYLYDAAFHATVQQASKRIVTQMAEERLLADIGLTRDEPTLEARLAGVLDVDVVSAIDRDPTIETGARLLALVRDARRSLALAEQELESWLADVLPGGTATVEGVGVLKARFGAVRTKWDNEGLRSAAVGVIADLLGVIPTAVEQVIGEWQVIASPSWKVGGVREFGLDPDEWCEKRPGIPHIEIA